MITATLICAALLCAWLGGYLWLTALARTAPDQTRPGQDEPDEPPTSWPEGQPEWWDQAAPDPTVAISPAAGTWGGTPQQITAELAAQHLEPAP
jgi:hypothetical protein